MEAGLSLSLRFRCGAKCQVICLPAFFAIVCLPLRKGHSILLFQLSAMLGEGGDDISAPWVSLKKLPERGLLLAAATLASPADEVRAAAYNHCAFASSECCDSTRLYETLRDSTRLYETL